MNHYRSNLNELEVNLRIHVTNVKNNFAILWKQLSYIMKTTLIYYENNLGIKTEATHMN
jgi:hypothetical protein